jgi:hypothetical protein
MSVRLIAIVAAVGLVLYFLFKGRGTSAAAPAQMAANTGDNIATLFQGVTATPTGVPVAPVSSAVRVTLPGVILGGSGTALLPGPAQPIRFFQPVIAAPEPTNKYIPPPVVLNKLFFSAGGGLG